MARGRTQTGVIAIEGMKPALAALTRMGKEASGKARDASTQIAAKEVARIRGRAAGTSRQSALVAGSIKTRRDRAPAIAAGGAGRLPVSRRGRPPRAGDVFFGAEFGGGARRTTRQFPPHKGTEGYFFWPTLRADVGSMFAEWAKALDQITDEWTRGEK